VTWSRAVPSLAGELALDEELSFVASSGGVVGWGRRLGRVVCPVAVAEALGGWLSFLGPLTLPLRLRCGVSHGSSWRVLSTRLSQWAEQVLPYTRLIGVAFGAPTENTNRYSSASVGFVSASS